MKITIKQIPDGSYMWSVENRKAKQECFHKFKTAREALAMALGWTTGWGYPLESVEIINN